MYLTANPHADAERWEDDQADKADIAERAEIAVSDAIKEALLEGLEWGPEHVISLPQGMPPRRTLDALYELTDAGHGGLIDRAVCMLARMDDACAKALIDEIAEAYAEASIPEWKRTNK